MLSLYLHIPFCDKKCPYCSFHVMALDGMKEPSKVVQEYLTALHKEIDKWGKILQGEEIRTIYFGGGTPSSIGADKICEIIDHLGQYFSFEFVEELSIEVNPYPESVLEFIDTVSTTYKKRPKVRFSIGIQSFDNEVLQQAGRQYTYLGAVDFLRKLAPYNKNNVSLNFDFIAFGKFNTTRKGKRQLWSSKQLDFLKTIAESGFADGFSLYTLELFEGSEWYHKMIHVNDHEREGFGLGKFGSDDDVYEEFALLKEIIMDAGYERYELSNFSLTGRNSIHNRAYRSMKDYLALGTSASGFLQNPGLIRRIGEQDESLLTGLTSTTRAVRWTNTKSLTQYLSGNTIDEEKTVYMKQDDYLTEQMFLALRTRQGVKNLSSYEQVLEPHYKDLVQKLVKQELAMYEHDTLQLTDQGMDIYNTIITELLVFG